MSIYYALVQEFLDQNPASFRHPGFTKHRIHLAHAYAACRVGWIKKSEIPKQIALIYDLAEKGLI